MVINCFEDFAETLSVAIAISKMTVRSLTVALRKKAEAEVNETPQNVVTHLAALKDWLSKQPHLHNIHPTDQWLIAFLRGSKYNISKTKDKLEMYYTLRTAVPEIFAARDPLHPTIQEILKIGFFLPLKKCTREDSPRPCLARVAAFGGTRHALTDLIKVALMVIEILMLEDDNFTISGEEVIADAKDVGFSILKQWTPSLAKKVVLCAEKALSVRLKNMHILYAPPGIKPALMVLKLFLGSKMKKRLHVYSKDYEFLYNTVDKSILPAEYGGTDGNVQELIDHWKNKVESYRDWFVQQENVHSDESKRIDISKNIFSRFGIVKCFKTLEID